MSKIDISEWKEFKVSEFFDINPTKHYNLRNAQLLDGGQNPVIGNSAYNNGVVGYTSQQINEPTPLITYSDTTGDDQIFYHDYGFVGYSHVQGLYPKKPYNNKWNRWSLLFFTTAFRKAAKQNSFNYGNKFTRQQAAALIIKLPVLNGSSVPDFIYMENYMKTVFRNSENDFKLLETFLEFTKD